VSAPPELPGVLASLAPILNSYGYLAVGGVLFLEDFGIPVPGETILIAAAVYAGAGSLNIAVVVGVAVLAAVAGDNVGFAIGHFGGRRLVERFGRYVLLTPARLETAERFFTRHGGKIIVVARFVEGLRQANGILAGLTGVPWRRFLVFNTLGAVLWVGVWASLGYLAGTNIGPVYEKINHYQRYALIALAALLLALLARRLTRHHGPRRQRHRTTHDDTGGNTP
jgi:membrane protein DedA with SNARE-associated domain